MAAPHYSLALLAATTAGSRNLRDLFVCIMGVRLGRVRRRRVHVHSLAKRLLEESVRATRLTSTYLTSGLGIDISFDVVLYCAVRARRWGGRTWEGPDASPTGVTPREAPSMWRVSRGAVPRGWR